MEKPTHPTPEHGEGDGHGHGHGPGEHHTEHHEHPTWSIYWKIALILTIITAVEVWLYETNFRVSRLFVPVLLILSAAKFAIVVLYYMHIKYDHKLFKSLFVGPLILASLTLIALMFLFGQIKLGA